VASMIPLLASWESWKRFHGSFPNLPRKNYLGVRWLDSLSLAWRRALSLACHHCFRSESLRFQFFSLARRICGPITPIRPRFFPVLFSRCLRVSPLWWNTKFWRAAAVTFPSVRFDAVSHAQRRGWDGLRQRLFPFGGVATISHPRLAHGVKVDAGKLRQNFASHLRGERALHARVVMATAVPACPCALPR
jgi:hypothetical protein